LTAGIAHEIKNPLNFVNNFSALGIELIGERKVALQAPRLDDKVKAQITELADGLKGNLDKVVEHGKRADSIVKNMLLHSRQESGEHRPVDHQRPRRREPQSRLSRRKSGKAGLQYHPGTVSRLGRR
jgi:two-component system NtrC family sensor kinase